ncbi:hypothetical protein [Polyangium mundeleinium]|uniref:Lipoprotein n=1 Tax=Polyangium mundeleinium TaxID=2995306 RepID=A0ABT5F2L9_9BACT|nr:hypothetical protein [Polyangium mundeleinium]MDC0748339.1 hypothetical protein [Polyangium mundeleinium]
MIKHIILALSVSLLAVACGGAPAEEAKSPEGAPADAKPAEGAPADAKPADGAAPAGDQAAPPAGDQAAPK